MQLPKNLQTLTKFYSHHRRLPSFREMLGLTGLKSTNAIHRLFGKLTEQGWLEKDGERYRLSQRALGVPKLGTVEAGWPSPAEEELANTMTLDEFLIGNREATFMLSVSGDSMIDAGIRPGDLLLVERGKDPREGDVVVAEVDGGWTLKFYRKRGRTIFLEAANKKYQRIYPKEELKIAAVVMAVIRKYHRTRI